MTRDRSPDLGRIAQPEPAAVRPGYWFKPKHHGYGAVPATWQGWAVTIAFSLALGLMTAMVLVALRGSETILGHVALCGAILFFVWRFVDFARARTDGEWLWRYKGEPYRTMLKIDENQEKK